jgi:hypothetical protein
MIKLEIPPHLSTEEWARLPTRPGERYEGLSRTTLLELWEQGDIKIASIRKSGSQKSIKLLHIPSLRAFLQTCVQAPSDNPFPGKKTARNRPKEQPTQQRQPKEVQ